MIAEIGNGALGRAARGWVCLAGFGAGSCQAPAPAAPAQAGRALGSVASQASGPRADPVRGGEPETAAQLRRRLLEAQDTDCDQKVTREDRGSRRFDFRFQGENYSARGHYELSNLLQELTLGLQSRTVPRFDRITEDPISRTSRRIRGEYWSRLTRTIDSNGLARMLQDDKLGAQAARAVYVPASDPEALAYFQRVSDQYNAAYEKLRLALTAAQAETGPIAVEGAIAARLATARGRGQLRAQWQRLGKALSHVAFEPLERELSQRVERLMDLAAQAERPCVRQSPERVRLAAKRIVRELAGFQPHSVRAKPLPEAAQWPTWVGELGTQHGPLSLALQPGAQGSQRGVPFVVPGGRFNEMYGWDSYFIVLGLLADDKLALAKSMVDNFAYSITHYGATLNANRTYYLTRSQPPLFASMIRAVWEATPEAARSLGWLRASTEAAVREYEQVWSRGRHVLPGLCRGGGTARVCLARYQGLGRGQPPEVEPGHFKGVWQAAGRSLEASYRARVLGQRDLEQELDEVFRHDRCMRESGHDTTYRFFWRQERSVGPEQAEWTNRCADFATVDLNSLLYRYEVDLAYLRGETAGSSGEAGVEAAAGKRAGLLHARPAAWCARARTRLELMQRHLWSASDGLFYDAFVSAQGTTQSGYVSATTLYPLWATAHTCNAAPPGSTSGPEALPASQRAALVESALALLEAPGGLLSTAQASRERFSTQADRQWDYPNGWAPHQMIAWQGLLAHGFQEEARRLAFRWLSTVLKNVVDFNGTIPEKYDVVRSSHAVFAEYGNVGTEFDYIAGEGFGWVNASFQVGLKLLSAEQREELLGALATRNALPRPGRGSPVSPP